MLSIFSPRAATVSLHFTKFAAIVFTTALLAFPVSAQTHEWPKDQSPDLIALRSSSSPAEKKLSFNLLLLSREARHAPLGSFASTVDNSVVAKDGTVSVEIVAYLSPSLMASPVMADIVRVNGAIPLPAYISDHLQARVDHRLLLDLAANPNVLSIRETSQSNMASLNPLPTIPAFR
jgi:hypothetical protein